MNITRMQRSTRVRLIIASPLCKVFIGGNPRTVTFIVITRIHAPPYPNLLCTGFRLAPVLPSAYVYNLSVQCCSLCSRVRDVWTVIVS